MNGASKRFKYNYCCVKNYLRISAEILKGMVPKGHSWTLILLLMLALKALAVVALLADLFFRDTIPSNACFCDGDNTISPWKNLASKTKNKKMQFDFFQYSSFRINPFKVQKLWLFRLYWRAECYNGELIVVLSFGVQTIKGRVSRKERPLFILIYVFISWYSKVSIVGIVGYRYNIMWSGSDTEHISK